MNCYFNKFSKNINDENQEVLQQLYELELGEPYYLKMYYQWQNDK